MEQQYFKRIYSIKELYVALYKGIRTYKFLRRSEKTKAMSIHFKERIMLAVTEVNGCEVCSYAHTKIALSEGMGEVEVENILSGVGDDIPENEKLGVLFAQHYAEHRGSPSEDSWKKIKATYEKELALGILGAIRVIMIGNIYGIAISGFRRRMKGEKAEETSLIYELNMMHSIFYLLPIALFHSFILSLGKRPII